MKRLVVTGTGAVRTASCTNMQQLTMLNHSAPCVAGFADATKAQAQYLAKELGMVYRGDLTHGVTAVLVCHRLIDAFGSAKYFKAMQWGIPVVSYDWLIESYIAGHALPIDHFKTDRLQRVQLDLPALQTAATTLQSEGPPAAVDEAEGSMELKRKTPNSRMAATQSAEARTHLGFSFTTTQQPSASSISSDTVAADDVAATLTNWKSAAGSNIEQTMQRPIIVHHATQATPTQGILAECSNRYSAKQLAELLQGKLGEQKGTALEPPYKALQHLHIRPAEYSSSQPSTPSQESTCSSGGLTPMSISKPGKTLPEGSAAASPAARAQHGAAYAGHGGPLDHNPQEGEVP
jgi:hypothetical protein